MQLIPDDIDLSAYVQAPDLHAKVRRAADFHDEVDALFDTAQTGRRKRHAGMLSAKAANLLEFRPGEVTCWAGYNGHRKSMFTSQVALDLCAQRERVLIASLEMAPAKTMERFYRQAAGAAIPPKAYRQQLRQWSEDRLWIFDHLGRLDPEQCIALLRYFAAELGGTQVFVDSMMMVCNSEEHLDEQKQFTTDLVRCALETGLHVHLIAHCRKPQAGEDRPPTKYDIRGSGAISDQAANVITVWANKPKKAKLEQNPYDEEVAAQPDALISCEKQRNGEWEGRLKYWFDEGSLRFCDDRTSPVEPYVLQESMPDESRAHAHFGAAA